VSPLLDKDTRTARVVAAIGNADGRWRPGSFVTAAIAIEEHAAPVVAPFSAIQTVEGRKAVFVRTRTVSKSATSFWASAMGNPSKLSPVSRPARRSQCRTRSH